MGTLHNATPFNGHIFNPQWQQKFFVELFEQLILIDKFYIVFSLQPKKVMTDRRSPTELGKKRKSHEEDLTKSTKKKLKTKESDDCVTDEEPKVKTEEEEAGDFSKFAISKATINTLQSKILKSLFNVRLKLMFVCRYICLAHIFYRNF